MIKSDSVSIIAAVRTTAEFDEALSSKADIIFDLSPNIMTIAEKSRNAKAANKKLFIHIDLASGIGKDKSGILFAKNAGIDGIISTRVNMIKFAHEAGLFTVQRFFIVDSQSVDTSVESIKLSKPDMVEVMPGIATKVISSLREKVNLPVIAGGLIESEDEIAAAANAGSHAVSTGKKELWNLM